MTFDELKKKISNLLPDADIQEDNYGQIIIYTGLKVKDPYSEEFGELVPFVEECDDEYTKEDDNG